MQGRQLLSVDDVKVEYLLDGDTSHLATGQLSLAVVASPPLWNSRPPSPTQEQHTLLSPQQTKPRGVLNINTISSTAPKSPRGLDLLVMTLSLPGDAEPLWEAMIAPTTRITSSPPSSYIFPNPSEGVTNQDSAGFIRLTLPQQVSTEVRETFESILWCETSFSTTTAPTTANTAPPSYADPNLRSRLVLLNDQGDVVGTLANHDTITEDASLSAENQGQHEKEPVLIEQVAGSSTGFTATPVSKLTWNPTPNPENSAIITGADFLSKGIIVGAGWLSQRMESGASNWVKTRPPTESPMEFKPTTKSRLETANKYTGKAVVVTGKTAAVIGSAASAVGARIAQATGANDGPGKGSSGWRGMVNKSLVAFNTVSDSIEASGKTLIASGSASTAKVVGHSYGAEAETVARSFGRSVENVALVYVDARGVTRRALLKAVGSSVIRAKMADGREVILSDKNDGQGLQVQGSSSPGGSRTPSPGGHSPGGISPGAYEKRKMV